MASNRSCSSNEQTAPCRRSTTRGSVCTRVAWCSAIGSPFPTWVVATSTRSLASSSDLAFPVGQIPYAVAEAHTARLETGSWALFVPGRKLPLTRDVLQSRLGFEHHPHRVRIVLPIRGDL